MTSSLPGCHDCNGLCCRRYHVPVNGRDLHRLSLALQLPAEAFVRVTETEEGWRGAFRTSEEDRFWRIELAHREDSTTCTFLIELPGGTGRCGVYPDRPDVCRNFPIQMRHAVPSVIEGIPCPPGCWEPVDEAAWAPVLDHAELEWRIYETTLERWDGWAARRSSREPAEPAVLFAWLADLYIRLETIRADVGEEGMATAGADVGAFILGDRDGPAADLIARCVWAAAELPGELDARAAR